VTRIIGQALTLAARVLLLAPIHASANGPLGAGDLTCHDWQNAQNVRRWFEQQRPDLPDTGVAWITSWATGYLGGAAAYGRFALPDDAYDFPRLQQWIDNHCRTAPQSELLIQGMNMLIQQNRRSVR
jgi:hypothetical protein